MESGSPIEDIRLTSAALFNFCKLLMIIDPISIDNDDDITPDVQSCIAAYLRIGIFNLRMLEYIE